MATQRHKCVRVKSSELVGAELDEVSLYNESGSRDQHGFLENTESIQKLMVHLEVHRRTGTLTLTSNSMIGKLLFAAGNIKHAICGSIDGPHALQILSTFPSAHYHFTINFDVQETHLNVSPMCYFRQLRKAATARRSRSFNSKSQKTTKRAPRLGS